jgi:hypothetical protein
MLFASSRSRHWIASEGETVGPDRQRKFLLVFFVAVWLFPSPTLGEELQGTFITLVTDDSRKDQKGKLLETFDEAVPLWAQALDVSAEVLASFRVRIHVFVDRERMEAAGVIPAGLPEFRYGLQRDLHAWVIRNDSEYMTRHLVLHEGLHAFMSWSKGGLGAGWFCEGSAEWLATHRWQNGKLEIGMIPNSPEETPYWGRIGLIEQARRKNQVPGLDAVLQYRSSPTANTEMYAWSWALMRMLESYPEYRPLWREALVRYGKDEERFNHELLAQLDKADRGVSLATKWQVWVWELAYGFEIENHRLQRAEISPPDNVSAKNREAEIQANQGWQAVCMMRAGDRLQIRATGRIVLGHAPKPWTSYPEGITVTYCGGRPLGELQAMRCDESTPLCCPRPQVIPVGQRTTVIAEQDGWLWMRCNDFSNSRSDNEGSYRVSLVAVDK